MITSSANRQMKRIVQLNKKAKARYEQRVFVVEGLKLCQEAPHGSVRATYVSESFLASEGSREALEGLPYETVSDRVFEAACDTKAPQGILRLVEMMEYELEDLLGENPHLLILEGIRDPGNLGTMLRAGEGAGATGVLMDDTTVDVFNPKVARAAMGSLYRIPFFSTPDLSGCIRELKRRGISMYAAHLKGTTYYGDPDYRKPTGFLIGNEARGLSPGIAELADCRVKIPLEGKAESLNAAVAAALLMYEANRQRRGDAR